MKAVSPAPVAGSNPTVRLLAWLLIVALLAPLTVPLAASAETRGPAASSASSAAITGNLAAPEPMTFPVVAGYGEKAGFLHGFAEQWQRLETNHLGIARSVLSSFSFASFASFLGAPAASVKEEAMPAIPVKEASVPATPVEEAAATSKSVDSITAPGTATVSVKNAPAAPSALPPPVTKTRFDFDGDRKADVAVWRPEDGTWRVFQSSTQELTWRQWGMTGDRIVPADYDGDGRTDYAVYTPANGMWSVLQSSNGQALMQQWGAPEDIPVPGDYDGDGRADIAVWRPSTGVWYIVKSSDGAWYGVQFGGGQFDDVPVWGDYDGDGRTDIAVWRPSSGGWYVLQSSDGGFNGMNWGMAGDIPVAADYDGDGRTDWAVWRPSTGGWYILNSFSGAVSYITLGSSDWRDVLVPADYDGDGRADGAVWRPSTGRWSIWRSSDSAFWEPGLGAASDVPVPAAFVKQAGATPTPTSAPAVPRAALGRARLEERNATGGTNLYSRNFSWGAGLFGLPGRAGMDAGLSLSYNSLVWTKVDNTMVFDADKSDVAPGFRFGFPVIEPVYTDAQTNKPTYLIIGSSGARTELRQTATPNLYESVDSSYVQLEVVGSGTQEQQQLVLRAADGTQMRYLWKAGAYRCSEIKDGNGNIITVSHDGAGILRSITDTLGRVISVSYDNALNPVSISQARAGGVTHTWATFSYAATPINHNFGGLAVSGPASGSTLKVLDRVTFADDNFYQFDYNPYGQVRQVNRHAADNHKLNHVAVDLTTDAASVQTDCPRFSQTGTFITDQFNGNQEAVTTNTIEENKSYNVPGASGTATLIKVTAPNGVVSETYVHSSGWAKGLPIATETCESAAAGSEACTEANRKRWTWTDWTQDDTNVGYRQNPRVVESKVGDGGNTRRTTLTYHPQFGLVSQIREYAADTTVLRRTATDYNLSESYTSRRIIGLPSERRLYEGESALMSKVTFAYDEGGFGDTALNQNIPAVQHDNTNYGAGFVIGRGNLTSTTRWDVEDSNNTSKAVTSTVKYNTAGAVVSQISPGSGAGATREVKIGYTDSFDDGANRNTFAYPTNITDPAGNSSDVRYRYDIGANVWARSPAPAGNTQGKVSTRTFDSLGRLERQTIVNTGAYTRYEYPRSGVESKVYTTITAGAGEALTESYADGAGRVRRSRTELPGSAGGWSGTRVEYDVLGRVRQQSVPTEVDSNWNPVGDDQTRGWLWTSQEYDWKGRVTKKVNTDGTFSQASYEGCGCAGGEVVTVEGEQLADGRRKQKIYSDILGRQYKAEVFNWNNTLYSTTVTQFNGRDQALTVTQTQAATPIAPSISQTTTLTYDGHSRVKTRHAPQQDDPKATVYEYYPTDEIHKMTDARGAVTAYTYNNRGLVTGIDSALPPVQGSPAPSGTNTLQSGQSLAAGQFITSPNGVYKLIYQTDGNLVLYNATNNTPLWTAGVTGAPGSTQMQTDGNLVVYNSGGTALWQSRTNNGDASSRLVVQDDGNTVLYRSDNTQAWSTNTYQRLPLSPVNTSVAFEYDPAGNRIWMTDNLGRTDYEYDPLSRLKSETRQFTETLPNGTQLAMADAPISGNRFKLTYNYGLANQLTSLTDPYGAVINYGYDRTGRLDNVTGTSFGGVASYASGAKYQAWGALKELTYGAGVRMTTGYNNRLQAASYGLKAADNSQIMSKNYEYYADGALRYAQDALNPIFDRLNIYDHVGRIKAGKTGAEARGASVTDPQQQKTGLPYRQSYEFNAFGNLTKRDNLHWGVENWQGQNNNLSYTYLNNRIQGEGWSYDADGRVLQTAAPDDYAGSAYNAAGQMIHSISAQTDAVRYYDGNGREIKRATANYVETSGSSGWQMQPAKYYIRSSVLGNEVVSEAWANGRKKKTFVRAAGAQIAYQSAYYSENSPLFESVVFEYADASGMSQRTTDKSGISVATGDGGDGSPVELDPLGNNVGTVSPYTEGLIDYQPSPDYPNLQRSFDDAPTYVNGQRVTATLDGMEVSFAFAMNALSSGSAAQCPNNYCGPQTYFNGTRNVLSSPFTAYADGRSGYYRDVLRTTEVDGQFDSTFYVRTFVPVSNSSSSYFSAFWGSQAQTQRQTTRSDLPDYARSVYKGKLGGKLTDCINSVFSKVITGQNGVTATGANLLEPQTIKNAPKVDDKSFTMFVLGGGTGPLAMGRSFYGDEKRYGSNGTLYIASDLPAAVNPKTGGIVSSTFEQYQRTYVHELGNLLSRKISPDGSARTFGSTPGIAGLLGSGSDPDTGVQLENCVFGNVIP